MATQLYSVIPNKPFGRGTSSTSISSDPNTRTYATSSGANITLGSAILSNGDLAIIHQSWNLSSKTEDTWDVFVVASGGGTTSVVATQALSRTYAQGAQVVKVPEYRDLSISSGFGGKSYGASVNSTSDYRYTAIGGLNAIAVSGTLTLDAVIHQNGYYGYISSSDRGGLNENQHFYWWYANAPSGGHIGGANTTDGSSSAKGGNSLTGYAGSEGYNSAEWNGGSGARSASCGAAGGHATDGGGNSEGNWVTGGEAVGNAALTSLHFGGGGGGAAGSGSGGGLWTGGSGGGAWIIWAKKIVINSGGGIQSKGGLSYGNNDHAGGPGAGGSILINAQEAVLNTGKIDTSSGAYYAHAQAASVGRFRLNYGITYSGSSSNTSESIAQDTKLIDSSGAFFALI